MHLKYEDYYFFYSMFFLRALFFSKTPFGFYNSKLSSDYTIRKHSVYITELYVFVGSSFFQDIKLCKRQLG